jgi:hypothetical protein
MSDLPAIRIAVPEDEPEILAMCKRLYAENGMFSLKEEKVRDVVRKCFRGDKVIVGVIGETGHIEASTCLIISDYFYSDDWHLAELWNFVDKDHRRSKNADALIAFGKSCAEKMGIPLLTGIITNKQMAGKVRLYRRSLGQATGAFFVYNAPEHWATEPMVDHRDLIKRLKDFAQLCNENKITHSVRKELGPLLREAAEALKGEDDLFGGTSTSTPKRNGSAHVGAGG